MFQILQLQMNDYLYHYLFTTFVSTICYVIKNNCFQIDYGSAYLGHKIEGFSQG